MNSKLKFTNRVPTDWKDLQNLVAEYLNIAGYKAITPYEIETVVGDFTILTHKIIKPLFEFLLGNALVETRVRAERRANFYAADIAVIFERRKWIVGRGDVFYVEFFKQCVVKKYSGSPVGAVTKALA